MTMVQHIIQYKYIYQAAIMYNELLQQRRQRAEHLGKPGAVKAPAPWHRFNGSGAHAVPFCGSRGQEQHLCAVAHRGERAGVQVQSRLDAALAARHP